MKTLIFFIGLFASLFPGIVCAKIKLPPLLSDNLVLQQQADVNFWGEAEPNAVVSIVPSWSSQEIRIKADASGKWKTTIPTPSASFQSYSIVIRDQEPLTLNNVLIGEVWLASGQSNMEMPVNGFMNCPVTHSNDVIADAGNHPFIRMVNIKQSLSTTPQECAEGMWKVSEPEDTQWFSATAYFYALHLQQTLQVPIGIIHSSRGATAIECWMPEELLKTYDGDYLKYGKDEAVRDTDRPMVWFNGMIHPCRQYTIKGFIWYQGCGNVGHADVYSQRMADLVGYWRTLWKEGDIPFYYVEIAPCNYENNLEGITGALLREAQFNAQKQIPNSGMVSTNDLVEPFEYDQIHPANKQEVGKRLAFQALNKTYGYKAIAADGPTYKNMEIQGNKILLSFDHAEQFNRWHDIKGFEVAGEDRVFYPAQAVLRGNQVEVFSEKIVKPVATRYCFRNFLIGNLKNHRGLPVIPFRTDRW